MTLRLPLAAVLAAAALLGLAAGPGGSQTTSAQAACQAKGPVLGVSRTIEIDTRGGPRYGLQQYKDNDILQEGEVILTFDDGPLRAYTTKVLEALDRHCTKATFFVVGSMALADPATLRETYKRGHTIGTHTWSHQYQLGRSNIGRATHEIELGFSAVKRALGAPVAPFFRFPFLSDGRGPLQHLAGRDIAAFSIDVDAIDYRAKGPDGPEVVFRTVMRELTEKKKGILLFHDIQPSTAVALPRILDALKTKGFRVVHIVPKGDVTTVASYDAMAEKEASRRRVALASQPLASRAVTWPLAAPAAPAEKGHVPHLAPQVQGGTGGGIAPPTSPVAGQPYAPPAAPAVVQGLPPADVQPQPEPRRRPLGDDDGDWRRRVFGN